MMAFGAVATGSMKAQLALSTAGTIKIIGFMPVVVAVTASTGISRLAVAVLLVTSVRKVTARQIDSTSSHVGRDGVFRFRDRSCAHAA